MEQITKIKRLQMFMIAFLVSVGVNLISTALVGFVGVTLPGVVNMLLTILQFVTYILIWVSFAQSKNDVSTRKKYLLLALLLTILTIVFWIFSIVTSSIVTAQALQDGIIDYSMDVVTMNTAMSTMPIFKMIVLINNGVALVLDIIYLGIGATIFLQNKQELAVAEQEYNAAYND